MKLFLLSALAGIGFLQGELIAFEVNCPQMGHASFDPTHVNEIMVKEIEKKLAATFPGVKVALIENGQESFMAFEVSCQEGESRECNKALKTLLKEYKNRGVKASALSMEEGLAWTRSLELGSIEVIGLEEDLTAAYYPLTLTEKQQEALSKLIKAMGELSWPKLLWRKGEMEQLGKKVDPVHPIRFLGYIFSHPELKKQMPSIQEGRFTTWPRFIKGLSDRMALEHRNGNLQPYLAGFCEHTGYPQKPLQGFIDRSDWEGLVKYLISH